MLIFEEYETAGQGQVRPSVSSYFLIKVFHALPWLPLPGGPGWPWFQ